MARGKVISDRLSHCVAVAKLVEADWSVGKIATRLGISPVTVRRLTKEATDKGLLKRKQIFQGDRLPQEILQKADALAGVSSDPADLEAAFKQITGTPVTVRIVNESIPDLLETRNALQCFGLRAAHHFLQVVSKRTDLNTAGIGYGSGIHHLLNGIVSIIDEPPFQHSPVTFIPLRGDAGLEDNPFTGSSLAFEFSTTMNGRQAERYFRSPSAVPPAIPEPQALRLKPRKVSQDSVRPVLDAYFELLPDFAECYRGSNSLIQKLDLIVCSVGPANATSPITKWIHKVGRFNPSEFGSVGDVAGIPILNTDKASKNDQKRVKEFEGNSLIGVRKRNFQRTVANGGISTLVAALDTDRAEVVVESVRQAMFNFILLDVPLANAVRQRVGC